jgi:hypothetical protein
LDFSPKDLFFMCFYFNHLLFLNPSDSLPPFFIFSISLFLLNWCYPFFTSLCIFYAVIPFVSTVHS